MASYSPLPSVANPVSFIPCAEACTDSAPWLNAVVDQTPMPFHYMLQPSALSLSNSVRGVAFTLQPCPYCFCVTHLVWQQSKDQEPCCFILYATVLLTNETVDFRWCLDCFFFNVPYLVLTSIQTRTDHESTQSSG
jgi:hypothetical protein